MTRLIKKLSHKAGLAPGTLVHVGEKKEHEVKITVIDYNESQHSQKEVDSVEECFPFKETSTVSWINVNGVHETDVIHSLGQHFGLHPLVTEDIVNTAQRPKVEEFEEYLYIVLKMIYHDKNGADLVSEQVSIVLGKNFVLSFQEREGDIFDPIRTRIKESRGKIRKSGTDYLAYAIVDSIVDNYFKVLETFGEKIETLEDEVTASPERDTLQTIHELKSQLIQLRKSIWPLRELIRELASGETRLIKKSTIVYLRDVYDHTIQVIDTVEGFRDMVSGMLDIYLSSVSNRMNEVMKVLTIIATIFIPLTFIAGIYGMNFEFMPELKWHWSYLVFWIVIVNVAIVMVAYFKRKKWL